MGVPLGGKYEVLSIEKRISLEAQDRAFLAPTVACNEGSSLFMLDSRDLEIWKYDHHKNHYFYFSKMGSGPGELNKNITGFYVLNDELVVLNANGTRLDSFSIEDGELRDSRQTGKTLYYQHKKICIAQSMGKFRMDNELGDSVVMDGFPINHYGPQTHSALFKNSYFLIAATMSNNGTIPYIIFDLKEGKANRGIIEKRQKINENDLPPHMKKQFSGLKFDELFFNNFQVIVTGQEYGFIITEYGMSIYEDNPTGGHKSVIHTINPETQRHSTIILHHKTIKGISLIIPQVKGTWSAYDTERHELVILKVRKLS